MTLSHGRANSRHEYFRMDVPRDVRALVGKTSWQHSLRTSDPLAAASDRARWTAFYKDEVSRLRAQNKAAAKADTDQLIRRAFARLARFFKGSLDDAVACQLRSLGVIVRSSWGLEQHRAMEAHHGIVPYDQPGEHEYYESRLQFDAALAIDDVKQQRLFVIRAELFERQGSLEGIVYRELAGALISRRQFEAIRGEVDYLPCLVPEIASAIGQSYDRVAEAYLAYLANHSFRSWPNDVREALAPVVTLPSTRERAVILEPETRDYRSPEPARSGMTIRDAFQARKKNRKIKGRHKTADEFETAIERFVTLSGNLDVATITRRMIRDHRDLISGLPARPGRNVARLPLRQQIELAAEKDLPTLMSPTVGKQIAAIKLALAAAVEEDWIATNPADGVTVEDAKWVGDERDHFSDDDMRRIYTSPLMTDPDACDDTMFWILFLAPFHGSRPGEHCKLKPGEVVREDGQWVMRFRRDRRARKQSDGTVSKPRRQKTKSSIRDVPLHWIVIEGGFLEFCDQQRERGANWLFDDLVVNGYGDRYQDLSRRINRALRKLGIADLDKSFYSTRHSMVREGRRLRVQASSLNQLTGHVGRTSGERYGQGAPIETLKEDIDQLEFRSVAWDAVVHCGLARVARRRKAFAATATSVPVADGRARRS